MEVYGNEATVLEGKNCSNQPLLVSSTKSESGWDQRIQHDVSFLPPSKEGHGSDTEREQRTQVTEKQRPARGFVTLSVSLIEKPAPLALLSSTLT